MKFHVSHGGIASKSRGAYTVRAEISSVSMTLHCEIVYVFTRVFVDLKAGTIRPSLLIYVSFVISPRLCHKKYGTPF